MMDNTVMRITTGIVTLKIAQLEQHLELLEQQHALSNAYPSHQFKLRQEAMEALKELQQLYRALPAYAGPCYEY